MKRTIYLILAFAAVLIIACNNQRQAADENPYAGAWQVTYAKYVYPDTTIELTQFANPNIKLLTKKHFAFGSQSGTDKISGGGGEYAYGEGSYTEFVKYHVFSRMAGQTINFKSKIEGELWTITYSVKLDSVTVDATETWKRIIE